MGYVDDTHMALFIPPNQIGASAGTWTLAVASNVWSNDRTAGDGSFTLYIPIPIPSNASALKGSKLQSVELMYSIATGACDDIATVELYKDTLVASAAAGELNSAAAVDTTVDTAHDTAAERKDIDEHRMVVTVDSPLWIDNDEAYHLEVVVDAAANTVFKVFGAIANFELRI